MFERYTDRARRVVVLAQEEARMLNHSYIGTEHILLGLIHEGEGIAAKSLESLGLSLEGIRSQVEEIVARGAVSTSGHIPFTPRAKTALELALREALQLGHNYIGTEHILLGLIREGEGVAAQVLVKLGAELTRVRQQVIQLLTGYNVTKKGAADISAPHKTVDEQIAELMLEAEILKTRKLKEQLLDAKDFEGAAKARAQEKELVAKHAASSLSKPKIEDVPAPEMRLITLPAEASSLQADLRAAFQADLSAMKRAVEGERGIGQGLLSGHDRAVQPKVSVDKDMFEKVKDGLAYVLEDPFTGELRIHGLKWTGRVITGVDWEGPLQ